MDITSSWTPTDALTLMQEDRMKETHLFVNKSTSLHKPNDDASCTVSILFQTPQKLMDIDIESSARHVEVYVVSHSPLGEVTHDYVDTIRGTKSNDCFHVGYAFSNQDMKHIASGVAFKFVSLQPPQMKDTLTLFSLKLRVYPSPMTPPTVQPHIAPSPPSMESNGDRLPVDIDSMKMILAMQQAMQKQMEEKIYQAVDSRLNQLSKRLQSTETLLQNLSSVVPKAEVKQNKDAFAGILDRLAYLEKEVRSMKAQNSNGEIAATLQQLNMTGKSTSELSSSHGISSLPTE